MQPKQSAARAAAPQLRYDAIRADVHDGDVVLFQGKGPLSSAIRRVSDSDYSHCGIAMWWQPANCHRRLMVFQAGGRGVEVKPASALVRKYDGRIDWWAVRDDLRGHVDVSQLFDRSLAELGKPYAVRGAVVLAARLLLDRVRRHGDSDASPDAMFCSWYVSRCFRQAGLDLCDIASDACTSPGDLARSGVLELRGVLRY